jgi:hypothetical protein
VHRIEDLRQRVDVVRLQVCRAVAHAKDAGVVSRSRCPKRTGIAGDEFVAVHELSSRSRLSPSSLVVW